MAAQQATASSSMMSTLLSPMLRPITALSGSDNYGPCFAHVGFTAEIPLPNQGFPARFLGPVGPYVTLLDGKALANGSNAGGETGPGEGRTAFSTPASPAVDGEAALF